MTTVERAGATETAGVEGNARLTAVTGVVLTALLLVEGFTILEIDSLLTLHVFLGLMLIGPVLLKCASTIYRFTRYYRGKPAYVAKGPPHPVLRVLGPLVILSSLAVLGTGAGLLAVKPGGGDFLLTLHQASFIVWVTVTSLHVLGHIRDAATTTIREVRPVVGDPARRCRALRLVALVLSLAVGAAGATAFTSADSAWAHGHRHPGIHRH